MADGRLVFDTKIDESGFEQGATSLKNAGNNLVKSLGVAFSAGAIAKGMVSLGKQSLTLASNLQEVQNVVDVTFGDKAGIINEFAEGAGEAFGMAELQAKQYAGTLGAMLSSMQLSSDAVLEMSQSLVTLTGDMASFYNLSHEEVLTKIRAGLAGEIEPLRQLGINMSIANLEAYALSQGIDKAWQSMTQAEQAVLRYNYLIEATAAAQGDFQRTQDSYENQMRITAMAITEVGTSIGQRLIPEATKATAAVGDFASELNTAIDARGLKGGVDYITKSFPLATASVSGLVTAFAAFKVVGTVTKLLNSFQKAQVQLALASKQAMLWHYAETGVLTTKEIVVAALTGKITMATAAQSLWNKAMMASPAAKIAVAIGAVVGATTLLLKSLRKTNPELFELSDACKEFSETSEELLNSLEESADKYAKTTEEIKAQSASARRLAEDLFTLSASYSGTAYQQERMKDIIQSLNGQYDGLNLSFDKQTGKINQTIDAIYEMIDAREADAMAAARQERLVELYKAQYDAEFNLIKAQKARAEATGTNVYQTAKLVKAEQDASEAYQQATEDLNLYKEVAYETTEELEAGIAAIEGTTEAVLEQAEAFALTKEQMQPIKDQLEKLADAYADVYNSVYNSLSGQFEIWEKVGKKVRLTTDDILKNTSQQAEYFASYADNIEALSGRSIAGIDSLISRYSDGSAESVAAIAALASATDEELSEIAANLNEQEISFDRISSAIAEEETNFSETLGQIETEYNTLVESLNNGEAVDMSQFSEAVSTAFADLPGMMGGIGSQMAEALMEPLRTLGAEGEEGGIGTQIAQTIATGLAEDETLPAAGQTAVMSLFDAMNLSAATAGFSTVGTSICTEFVGAFSNLQSQMDSIGTNAVGGLIAGINAKKPDAVAAAKALASAVQAAFKVRLRIQSPSKVFYGFGENTVQGFTNAIKDGMQTVRSTMIDFSDMVAAPFATSRTLHETIRSAPAPASGGNVNVTQNIYAEKQSPAQMLREARWQQERAVLVGV